MIGLSSCWKLKDEREHSSFDVNLSHQSPWLNEIEVSNSFDTGCADQPSSDIFVPMSTRASIPVVPTIATYL